MTNHPADTPDEGRSLPDMSTAVDLGDGLTAVIAVSPDGERWPWLAHLGVGATDADGGCCCAHCAPHEQTGPLTAAQRLALGLQCRAITARGRRCAKPAADLASGVCAWHRHDAAPQPPAEDRLEIPTDHPGT